MSETRSETIWIKAKLRAALKPHKIGLLPGALDALVDCVWGICQTERAACALILAAAHDQFGPLDDAKIARVMDVIELHDETAPGKCSVGGQEITRPKTKPKG